ncbi:MAG: helix-turn-helix domain-containing protein [Bacilli bacterium]|nr:helix-turn-helix domain-containing protein [Bacilli bacterium]
MPATNEIIASNIKDLRKSKGMTQSDLADKLGYTVQAISRWEKAKSLPDPIMLYNLAELFGVEITYFYQENHIEVDPKQEEAIKKRENLFRITLALSALFVLGILAVAVLVLIDDSVVHIVLWALSFVGVLILMLGAFLKNGRIVKIFIPFVVISMVTSLYFSLKGFVDNLKFIFIPMVVLLLAYFIFIFIFNRRKI